MGNQKPVSGLRRIKASVWPATVFCGPEGCLWSIRIDYEPRMKQYFKQLTMLQKNTYPKLDAEAEERLFESQLAQREKKSQRKMKMLEGKSIGRWNSEEQVKYYVFLVVNQKFFEKKDMRRNDKVFKMMSKFITTRTPDQCRSHHQKVQRKYPNIGEILSKLSEQFGEIDVQGVIEGYKTRELLTADSSIFQKQRVPEEGEGQGQPKGDGNFEKGGEGENVPVQGEQLQVVNQPAALEQADDISFFHEEEPFCLLEL